MGVMSYLGQGGLPSLSTLVSHISEHCFFILLPKHASVVEKHASAPGAPEQDDAVLLDVCYNTGNIAGGWHCFISQSTFFDELNLPKELKLD